MEYKQTSREILYRELLRDANYMILDRLREQGEPTEGCMDAYPTYMAMSKRGTIPSRIYRLLRDPREFSKFLEYIDRGEGRFKGERATLNPRRMYLSHHLWDDLHEAGFEERHFEALTSSLIGAVEKFNDEDTGAIYEWKAKRGV